MKKVTSLLLFSAAFVLASCGGNNSSTPAETSSSKPVESSASSASSESSVSTEASVSSEASQSEQSSEASQSVESSEASQSEESSEAVSGYVVRVNDVPADIAVVAPGDGSTDKGIFVLPLETGDVVTVSQDGTAILFAGYNGEAYDEASEEFEAYEDSDYKFYITAEDVIWVVQQKEHSGEVTVDLYAKFAISAEELRLVAYAWIWSNDTDGAWTLATYVHESWESESNHHYTISATDPVGKSVVLALFGADSGVTSEAAPTSWDGVAKQSGDATIADWGTAVGADLPAKSN